MEALTERQKLFVKEYLVDFNATQAAIRAGYSEKGAGVEGHRLLKKPKIQEALKDEIEARGRNAEITAEDVIRQLGKIAFLDVTEIMEWTKDDVYVKPSSEIDGTVIERVTKTINEKGDVVINIVPCNRMKALELLAKRFGLLKDRLNLEGSGTIQLKMPEGLEESDL